MTTQFRSPFTVKRKTEGQFVNGIWQEGSLSTFTIKASVQPLRGEEMEMLPEGRRTSQAVRIYTNTKLETTRDNNKNPDILEAFGNEYEITIVEPWQSNVISHYKCIGVKK